MTAEEALLGDVPWRELRNFGGPVYGLTDSWMGLTLGPIQFGQGKIGLGFKTGRMDEDGRGLYVEIVKGQADLWPGFPGDTRELFAALFTLGNLGDRRVRQEMYDAAASGRFNPLDPLSGRELRPVRTMTVQIPTPETRTTLRELFEIPLLMWSVATNEGLIVVCSFGMVADELESASEHIGRVDFEPDIIDRYKREFALRMGEAGSRRSADD
jgi:hypothetical protein